MGGICFTELTTDFTDQYFGLINLTISKYLLLIARISLPKSTRTPRTVVNFTMYVFQLLIQKMDIFVVMGTAIVEK